MYVKLEQRCNNIKAFSNVIKNAISQGWEFRLQILLLKYCSLRQYKLTKNNIVAEKQNNFTYT